MAPESVAVGGRLLAAGGGDFLFLSVEPAHEDALRHSLEPLIEYRFRFVVGGEPDHVRLER